MHRRIKVELRETVAVVSIALASAQDRLTPDPGFSAPLRRDLAQALAKVQGDTAVRAVLLRAGDGGWPFAEDLQADRASAVDVPDIAALADVIEGIGKPVVVALEGRISSATLALALAADWRIAAPDTQIVPVEAALATVPGNGVLVRAARRAGAAAALRLGLTGRALDAADAAGLGLVDGVVEAGDAGAAALSVARSLAAAAPGAPLPPHRADGAGLTDPAAFLAAIVAARGVLPQAPPSLREARARAIDCVEAALLLPRAEALEFADVARDDLDAAPVCRALVHVATSERRAARRAVGAALPVSAEAGRIGFWESGAAALALAEALAAAGHTVVLGAREEAALADALATLARHQLAAETAGRLSAKAREAAWARVEGGTQAADLVGCDWVLASADLAAALPPDVPLLLAGAPSPNFPTAPSLRLVAPSLGELTAAPGAALALTATVAAALLRARITVLSCGAGPLGITDRLATRLFAAAERAVLAGARPDQVDAVLGLAEAPFQRADRIGLARVVSDLRLLGRAPGPLCLRLLAERQIGKSSAFYRGEGTPPDRAVAEVTAFLPALRAEAGLGAVPLSPQQIRARLLAELADEGAAMLQSGVAKAAGDIDLAAVHGLGLPRASGGPMHMADALGLLATRSLLRAMEGAGAPPPEALWDVLIRNGRRFADLDQPGSI